MAYDAAAIANYFLDLADRKGSDLDPMKIQKLVYFGHGWNLALTDAPLIKERIEAWEYGPVIPPLYGQFKKFGNGKITERAVTYDFEGLKFACKIASIDAEADAVANALIRSLLDRIWEVYGALSGIQLSKLTHADGSPWAVTYAKNPGQRNLVIDDDLIKEDFKKRLAVEQ
jgi:uncharacterized phage-associated protein